MAEPTWHLITGEYPPCPGGVSDYSCLVATGLAQQAGREVHVWTGSADGPAPEHPGVVVHRDGGRWTAADLARLDRELNRFPGQRLLLVQYVHNLYGGAFNIGFTRWLNRRRAVGDDVRPMFHEAVYPWILRDPPRRWLVAAISRLALRNVLAASTRAYISIPAWEPYLRRYGPGPRRPVVWSPVPSTIPVSNDVGAVAEVRARLAPGGEVVIGHFGTYAAWLNDLLRGHIRRLLDGRRDRMALLLGRGGDRLAAELAAVWPDLADRVRGPGSLDPRATSIHLQACDLMLQPYGDGVSSRRTTAMACLAHGRPLVTTRGHLTESLWADSAAVALAPARDHEALVQAAEALLDDPEARERLGANGQSLYEQHFAVARTVERLLSDD